MPLKVEALEEASLNLTPMIDVVFNLLIFFMVGTKFADMERQFDVHLPQVSQAQPLTNPPDEIVVNVFGDGLIVVNQQTLSLEALETRLQEAHGRYADQAVLIRGDGSAVYQNIMDVLAVCHRAQIVNFSLAAQLKSE
ncbi:MAG: biopolymer transporter ExbD [Planctomycetaceae bacterium]|nr:biopolymer transporter ExbD [Planctomycetaceae bacterium]